MADGPKSGPKETVEVPASSLAITTSREEATTSQSVQREVVTWECGTEVALVESVRRLQSLQPLRH